MASSIPIFRLVLNRGVSYEEVQNHPNVQEIVINETVDAISKGIKYKRLNVPLFQINDSNYIIGLDKIQWRSSLQNALKYYEKKEEYNKCSEIVTLIKLL